MYGLYGWLLAKGQIAYINGVPEGSTDFVAVYPEIYRGNPANADHVVRYLLNVPGVMGRKEYGSHDPLVLGKQDKVYTFSQLYNKPGQYHVDDDHIMFLPIIDTRLFKVTNTGKRTRKCKFIGKGSDFKLPETEGLFEVTRPFANDQAGLADYLNECEVMYSYDNNSAMFEIARLCGCRIVIIPSIYSREEFAKYEPGMNGISYGLKENVPLDAVEFRNHYKNMVKVFEERLEYFIDETQK